MAEERGAIEFATRLLALLDEGQFAATYKYAVLLGLMDLCFEQTSRTGVAPTSVTTRQLADRVVELYWPQTRPYHHGEALRQNAGGQAVVLSKIGRFRAGLGDDPLAPLWRARRDDSAGYERLVRSVEWKLIKMPLPLVQRVGTTEDRFLYQIGWDEGISRASVGAYQRGRPSEFDSQIRLQPNVGEWLVTLNGLLRPIIYRSWTAKVAQINRLPEAELERFLFSASREATRPVRKVLRELQGGLCFYCQAECPRGEVDHFIPWSRFPEDGLDNLVMAHRSCNGAKRDHLAYEGHLERWLGRDKDGLEVLADQADWVLSGQRLLGATRAMYLHFPSSGLLWVSGKEFRGPNTTLLQELLAA